jgi:hypothetical protein
MSISPADTSYLPSQNSITITMFIENIKSTKREAIILIIKFNSLIILFNFKLGAQEGFEPSTSSL